MTPPYGLDDLRRGYDWLDHRAGVTEVSALSCEYRAGDADWNNHHNAWPVTTYITSFPELLRVVRSYAGHRMVCYGLNPRPGVLSHPHGRVRSAKERDILVANSLVCDLDVQGDVTPDRLSRLDAFLDVADEYFAGLGFHRPVRAGTGRGRHLLFAYPPVLIAEHPDFRGQLRSFKEEFAREARYDLRRMEVKLDSTQDLRRMVRCYGTAKPTVGIISTFPDRTRVPDEALRSYLLSRKPYHPEPQRPRRRMSLHDLLPEWFPPLLARDRVLALLWENRGKPQTSDTSNSGYDFTIASYLLQHTKNPDEVATIIALRPTGAKERACKGVEYLLRTVENALARQQTKGEDQ